MYSGIYYANHLIYFITRSFLVHTLLQFSSSAAPLDPNQANKRCKYTILQDLFQFESRCLKETAVAVEFEYQKRSCNSILVAKMIGAIMPDDMSCECTFLFVSDYTQPPFQKLYPYYLFREEKLCYAFKNCCHASPIFSDYLKIKTQSRNVKLFYAARCRPIRSDSKMQNFSCISIYIISKCIIVNYMYLLILLISILISFNISDI